MTYRALSPEGMIVGPPCKTKSKALEIAKAVWMFRGCNLKLEQMWTSEPSGDSQKPGTGAK